MRKQLAIVFPIFFLLTAPFTLAIVLPRYAVAKDQRARPGSFTTIEPGSYQQGDASGEWDERPVRVVEITRAVTIADRPVTNSEFEKFRPEHRELRAEAPDFSADDSPAVMVSWEEAQGYCDWLSKQSRVKHRLPTEAEWEFVARQRPDVIGPADKLPEEWCFDWYGPYTSAAVSDPIGSATGAARVVRGGTYRSKDGHVSATNRLSNLPDDRNRLVGFRVVQGELPASAPVKQSQQFRWSEKVNQQPHDWSPPVDMTKPYFAEPLPYVKIPAELQGGPLFVEHNHDPAITYCPNGDLFAIWYSTKKETGRELSVAAARLRKGAASWDDADLFWDVADRNDHAPSMWTDPAGKLYQFNGHGVSEGWDELAVVMRTSSDNGQSWSTPQLINDQHGYRNQPIAGAFGDDKGNIYLPCDAVPGGAGGTALHISQDGGRTWVEHGKGQAEPKFEAGHTGAWIAGIHAGVAKLDDGRLIALGRGNDIDGHMPMSVSTDNGRTWRYSASPFPPLGGGQRLVLKRLQEGPLLLISFTRGSKFVAANGKEFTGKGMFAALSDDGGQTWSPPKLLTDGKSRTMDGNAWTDTFKMDATHAEPKGYLAAVQTPDGIIHLISSGVHYRFNLAWVKLPPKSAP